MSRSVFSQSWHNVANLRPRLSNHARIHSHVYRGQHWFVIQDPASGRHHRLSPQAHTLVSRMDGINTVQSLWDEACKHGGDNIPPQDEIVDLLMQLNAQDLLYCDVTPDATELLERYHKERKKKWKQWFLNPISLKIPLLNPESFLTRWAHRLAWLFGPIGMMLWLATVIPALILAGQHWGDLTENLSDRLLSGQNLLLMALVFPVVKILHELGHGFATKAYGGSVHEMGIMFLVFAPVPYVDASAASAFRSKYQRAVVGAAGMLVEVFLAALAMYIWVLVEPGQARALAFNVMIIAGISTIIVNGNPLLRYDGYYILTDLIELPNLGERGKRYLTLLCDRYLFGARELEPSPESPSEKRWLVIYTITSWCYRMLVMISIILFIAGEFFFFGFLLALWSAITLFVVPLWKGVKHIVDSPTLQRHRARAIRVSSILAILIIFITGAIPVPLYTQAEGVVWLPEQAQVRASTDGFFRQWLVPPGSVVHPGTPLLVMADPQLDAELSVAQAKLTEMDARYRAEQFTKPAQAEITRQQREHEQRTLERVRERHRRLVVRSNINGVLTVANAGDMRNQFFKQGDMLGYILDRRTLIARVAVTQDNIDLVRTRLKQTELRFVDIIPLVYTVAMLREVPGGVDQLPSAALSNQGGGQIPVDPKDPEGLKTLERIFLIDFSLPARAAPSAFGERVYVRFTHESEPLAVQAYRRVRQLFLSRFHV